MGIVGTLVLVIFVIAAILLILLVLVQGDDGDGLGGIFAGGSSSAFGSRSGNILTRITSVLGASFLILSLGMAILNRDTGLSGIEAAGLELVEEHDPDWFLLPEAAPGEADTGNSSLGDTTPGFQLSE